MPDRRDIYYWKCDRPAPFHGIVRTRDGESVEPALRAALMAHFAPEPVELRPGTGQGNHLTWRARIGETEAFIRVEDGPERDDYLEVEWLISKHLPNLGVPGPKVLAVDASFREVPFAWQAMEFLPFPDLNQHWKRGDLDTETVTRDIGVAVAKWQELRPQRFGPFSVPEALHHGNLEGLHPRYEDYFLLRLDGHLAFLAEKGFLSVEETVAIRGEIEDHRELLRLDQGVLVHKDLALWNILGTKDKIEAFIDWDDAISGDPMDDLSLLGCFHGAEFLYSVAAGYSSVRPLPKNHARRFWLHLLRNMIVKSVIRVGAGYFERNDGFFLIGAGKTGTNLRDFTLERLRIAREGLRQDAPLELLG